MNSSGGFRGLRVFLRDGVDPLLPASELMHPALAVEVLDRGAHLATRKLLDHLAQLRLLRADNLIERDGLHSGFLQLREGAFRPRPPHAAAGRLPAAPVAGPGGFSCAGWVEGTTEILTCGQNDAGRDVMMGERAEDGCRGVLQKIHFHDPR